MRGFESSMLYRRLGGLTASVTAMLTFRAGQGKLASRPRCPWYPQSRSLMRIVRGVALRRRSIRIYDWGPMGRLCSVLTVVILFGLVGATSATAALSNDGRVTVEYSGKLAQTYVAN